jgi:hypothetical protein
MLPSYITHYYWGKDSMLKNLCNLPFDEATAVITKLIETRRRVWLHSGYLRDRYRVETWLYNEFVNKGKKPHLRHPLYFVLGENNDFFRKNGFFSDKDPEQLQLPLQLFSSNAISFTYPDSMTSCNIVSPPPLETYELRPDENGRIPSLKEIDEEMRKFGDFHRKPQHGQVFTLEEIVEDVVSKYGLPGIKWKEDPKWKIDRYVEVQVWDDRPIWDFLTSKEI